MPQPVLWRRMTLAIVLMVGFYALALTIAGLLLYLPYAVWHYLGSVQLQLLAFCLICAACILVAIAPRFDKFADPGPLLEPEQHPALFHLIRDTATATAQAPPDRVYLVPDFNAFVAQRGGIMGMGSERVMGLGLPLMYALSIPEFKAVLAHEFGHFHGGDTALGPWLYKTRAAIERTVMNLSGRPKILRKPFEWYGHAFLRITHGVSRQQEIAADALSVSVVDAASVRSGLLSIHRLAPAYGPFWSQELGPALQAGFRPPLMEGWNAFVTAPDVAEQIETLFRKDLEEGKGNPLDTHPPLRERLAALPEAAPQPGDDAAPAAVTLLADPQDFEERMIRAIVRSPKGAELTPVTWNDLGEKLWVPIWTEMVRDRRTKLAGVKAESVVRHMERPAELAVLLRMSARVDVAGLPQIHEAKVLIGAALTLALVQRGFVLSVRPGETVTVSRGELRIAPFALVESVEKGDLMAERWESFCTSADIAGLELASVVPPDAPAGPKPKK